MKRSFQFVVVSVVLLLGSVIATPGQLLAYEIVDTKWGFNGEIIPQQINPVFILLQNNSGQEEDLVLNLEKIRGASRFGAKQAQQVYLTAGSERWVTFYVYFENLYGTLSLTDGSGKRDSITVPNQKGKAARVLLVNSGDLFRRTKTVLPRFDEELFPPNLSGTDCLEAVYLDHVPSWRQERRGAFWAWLNQGGRLHLLKGNDGRFPVFRDELDALNAPVEKQHIGNGIVLKHEFSSKQLDKSNVESINAVETAFLQSDREIEVEVPGNRNNNYGYGGYEIPVNQNVSLGLKELVNPHHNWAVIYTASFVYLLLIFPGGYLVSRWKKNYWATYGTLLAGVVCFSFLFNMVGSRGYGESTQINSVALAKVLPEDQVDVVQYSNAFVTDGDYYKMEYEGRGLIYTTGQEQERVNGVIQNGVGGSFSVDIPPFSSRPFILRRQINLPAPQFEITRFNPQEGLGSLLISANSTSELEEGELWAVYGNTMTILKMNPNKQYEGGKTRSLRKLMDQLGNYRFGRSYSENYSNNPKLYQNKIYREINQNLVLQSLGVNSHEMLEENLLPRDRVYLFLNQPFPESFHAINSRFAKQDGKILFAYELLLSESS